MTTPDELEIGQAWDDDTRGTQRVIVGFTTGPRVTYKTEVRHRLRGVEWVERSCYKATFWDWIRASRAVVR